MKNGTWGIILWGLFFVALGFGIFNLREYYWRAATGRSKFTTVDILKIQARLTQAEKTTTNQELKKQIPEINKEFNIRSRNMDSASNKMLRTEALLYFPIMGAFCMVTGLGLIFQREVARKLAVILSVLLGIGFFCFIDLVKNVNYAAVQLDVFEIDVVGKLLKNEAINFSALALNQGNSYWVGFYLQCALFWALFAGLVIWYFSRKNIREKFVK